MVPSGSASTAALPRSRIGDESRYVLAAHPLIAVRAREDIKLPADGELRVAAERPASVPHGDVRFDASFSVRDPAAPAATMEELRAGGRITVNAAPLVLREQDGAPPALVLPVPEAFRGKDAILTVLARPLSPTATVRVGTDEQEIPPGSRLVFGYAVEEPGWAEGWPPVRFRVSGPDGVTLFDRRIDPAADPRDRRWFDASVDLAPLAGRRARLVFEAEALADAPGASIGRSFGVVSNPMIVPPAPAATPPWSIVLISLDTLRAQSVSAYGHTRETMPVLDRRLAAAGVLMRSAVSAQPFTPPSHMSMLTGLEPCAHGVKGLHDPLAPERTTLAEAVRAAGYETAAFTEDAYLIAGSGFDRGFDVYRENRSEEAASPGFGAETFADASAWLAGRSTRPFFVFIHTYQVHGPFAPPRGYATLFADADQSDDKKRSLVNYEREIRYTDDLLAGLLDTLVAHGLSERTIIALTSDHGEGFGEHFWTGHGFDLHDEALLVPLVIRAPGLVPAGRVVDEQVGLIDLAPTLLELVGLPPLPDAQGRSFARLVTGRGTPFEDRPLMSTAFMGTESIRTRAYKYIKMKDSETYYDLPADPLEQRGRLNPEAKVVEGARAALAQAHADCDGWRAAHPAGGTGGPTGASGSEPGWLINREEVERKLRSLGYVQ